MKNRRARKPFVFNSYPKPSKYSSDPLLFKPKISPGNKKYHKGTNFIMQKEKKINKTHEEIKKSDIPA